jgi:hypothetical protein
MTNAEFLEKLHALGPLGDGIKCRWIFLEGSSFDVLEGIGVKYSIPGLVLEDMSHIPQRVKLDYYDGCIYVSCVEVSLKKATISEKSMHRVQSLAYSQQNSALPIPCELLCFAMRIAASSLGYHWRTC